jgi:serine/threonine protein kinase
MQYMHDVANVVNRDIKPDNMLFMTSKDGTDHKGDRAQIADFTTVL